MTNAYEFMLLDIAKRLKDIKSPDARDVQDALVEALETIVDASRLDKQIIEDPRLGDD
jgi:hypothetical protein